MVRSALSVHLPHLAWGTKVSAGRSQSQADAMRYSPPIQALERDEGMYPVPQHPCSSSQELRSLVPPESFIVGPRARWQDHLYAIS